MKAHRSRLAVFGALAMLTFLHCSVPVDAQRKKPPEAIAHLYKLQEHIYNDKFYREHIPLDGDAVPAIPFRRDSLYGFVDKASKKWLIEPRFSQVFAVYREGAIVEYKSGPHYSGNYGVVAFDGHFIIKPAHEELFKEGNIYHGIRYGMDTTFNSGHDLFLYNAYYTEEGRLLFECKAHDFASFSGADTMMWARYGPEFAVYGRSGKILKRFPVSEGKHFAGIFNNTLVFAEGVHSENQVYTGYTVAGAKLWSLRCDHHASAVIRMSEDVFGVLTDGGFYLTNKAGTDAPYGIQNEWIGNGFEHNYPLLSSLSLIPVQDFETQKTGYINKHGKLVIPCKYKYAGEFHNSEAPFLDSALGEIGFMNTTGQVVVQPFIPADNLEELMLLGQQPVFSDGLCMAQLIIPEVDSLGRRFIQTDENNRIPHRIAYFDRQGNEKFLLSDSVRLAGPFSDGLAPVVAGKERRLGFIDTTGRTAIPARYELAVAGAYPFPQIVMPAFIHGYAYIKSFKGYIGKDGYEYFSGKRVQDHYDFSH